MPTLSFEATWLVYTIILTALLWVPYILNQIGVRGLIGAMQNPRPDAAPLAGWAQRAKAAHTNAVENLVLFAPLVILVDIAKASSSVTQIAVVVYFAARVAHYIIYVMGVPVLRTLIFATGLAATLALALALLGIG